MYYATGDPITIGDVRHYSRTTFTLTVSEYVTMIEGGVYQSRIGYLTFVTNKRTHNHEKSTSADLRRLT